MREKNSYAVAAAVVLNVIGILVLLMIRGVASKSSDALGVCFVIGGIVQLVGYCYFESRFQGKKLMFNLIFFPVMCVVVYGMGFVIGLLDFLPDSNGLMFLALYVLHAVVMQTCYSFILPVRVLIGMGEYFVKHREMKKRLLTGAGMLILTVGLAVSVIEYGGMYIESSFNYLGDEIETEEYKESLEFVERIKEREKREAEREKQKEQKASEKEKTKPEKPYNEEECERIRKMVEENRGEQWTEEDVKDWAALEWKPADGDYYVVSIDCLKDDRMHGKLDLTEFSHLKRLDFSMTDIEEVILPDSIETLTEEFQDCKKLKKVTFGKGLKELGDDTFIGCKNLETLVFQGDAPEFTGYMSDFNHAKIYYSKGAKGWNKGFWKENDVKPKP